MLYEVITGDIRQRSSEDLGARQQIDGRSHWALRMSEAFHRGTEVEIQRNNFV